MKLPVLLSILAVFIFQGCQIGTYRTWKNEQIDDDLKQEIHGLNDKIFNAVKTNNIASIRKIMSKKIIENGGNHVDSLVNQISPLFTNDNYRILDEYYIRHSPAGIHYYIPSGTPGDNDYLINYVAINKEVYVAFLVTNAFNSEILITAIYGKYENDWKLNHLVFGTYKLLGKTPFELFELAKKSYNKSYLVDAVNFISLSNACIKPAGQLLQYNKENEIKSFYEMVMKEAKKKYQFPLILATIDSKPKIFKIYPELKHCFSPVVEYISTINLKDTSALKIENEEIKKEIGQVFTGLDKNKEYIFYQAFNEMPVDKSRLYHCYNFVDDRTK